MSPVHKYTVPVKPGEYPMNFFAVSNRIFCEIRDAINPLIGTEKAGIVTGIGADGSPTRYIDKISEDIAVSIIREEELCQVLLSEEAGKIPIGGQNGTIFLDPVDGTYNAVMNIPFFAVSIAYAENGHILKGFVGNLTNGDIFTATRGSGAFLNKQQLKVSQVHELQASAMSIYGKHFQHDQVVQLIRKIRRFRQFGASALELSYVGGGKIDGFVDLRHTLRATDAAAGVLILQEAGGLATDLEGNPLVFPDEVCIGRCLIGTNRNLHQKVVEYLR